MIVIIGKRWFQRTYGNTYHSVTIQENGEPIAYLDMRYGYGEQYLQSAHEELVRLGKFKGDYWAFQQDMRNHRDKYTVVCVDVPRQKDL